MAGNTYRAVSARAKVLNGEDVFEAEFTPVEEQDALEAGHLEIVPRDYEVLSNNFAAGKQGATVSLALVVEQEAALIAGGHIERAVSAPKKKG